VPLVSFCTLVLCVARGRWRNGARAERRRKPLPAQLQPLSPSSANLDYPRASASRTVRRTAISHAVPARLQAVSDRLRIRGFTRSRVRLTG